MIVSAISYNGFRVEFVGDFDNDGKWDYFRRTAGVDSQAIVGATGVSSGAVSGGDKSRVVDAVPWVDYGSSSCTRFARADVTVQACASCTARPVDGDGHDVGRVEQPDVHVTTGEGSQSGDGGDCVGATGGVGVNTLLNRRKRQRKAENKRKRRETERLRTVEGVAELPVPREQTIGVQAEVSSAASIPEWRRHDVKASFHKGVFAECSAEMKEQLRESRARMLVARNEAAVVRAEHDRRGLEARLQSQLIEREVEAGRLKADAESRQLLQARLRAVSPGFAETVISGGAETVFSFPSLSSGSVSPNSSVSVEQVVKMERLIERLLLRVGELEAQGQPSVGKSPRESSNNAKPGPAVSGSMLGNAAGGLAPGLSGVKSGKRVVEKIALKKVVKGKYDASGFPLDNGYGLP